MALERIVPNTRVAVDFLLTMQPGGPWHLVAIGPEGVVSAHTFKASEEHEMYRWINERQGKENLYFHVNRLKKSVRNRKAKKSDVAEAIALHVDVDNPSEAALGKIKAYRPEPTCVLFSGGGYQAFWRLQSPSTDLDLIERTNRGIANDLGGDNCQNVDRIMRLPGTINVPNPKKQARGRVPALAYVLDEATDFSRSYRLETFRQAPAKKIAPTDQISLADVRVVEPRDLPHSIEPGLRLLIETGDDPERPRSSENARFPSRSEARWAAGCALARAGIAPGEIAGLFINPALGISESVLDKRNPKAEALREALRAHAAVDGDWPDLRKNGTPTPTMRNTILAIQRLNISCEYDAFKNRKRVGGHVIQSYAGDLTDDACAMLRKLILDQFGFDPGRENTRDAVNTQCLENRLHPIRDYIDGLSWDGTPRLGAWLVQYLGAENSALIQAIGKIMLIAGVRRIREPGSKFDTMVILEGAQGSGKSTALLILAGAGNFSDQDLLTLDPKAQMETLEGVWIQEICELDGLNRSETTKVKAFLSRSEDRGRPAYARFKESWPRQCIFVGTTNDDQYLRDTTGNRRFWPVKTGTIDLEGLRRDRDQLWAEAAYWETKGASLVLPEELWTAAAVEQEARMQDDPWLDVLAKARGQIVNDMERISTETLMSEAYLNIAPERRQPYHPKRIANLMRKLGWEGAKKIRLSDGTVIRGYERPSDSREGVDASKF